MKIVFLHLLLIGFVQTGLTQLSGKLTDPSGKPIASANINLLSASDSLVLKTIVSDETGAYSLESIMPGKYVVRVSSIGYNDWTSLPFELTSLQRSKDLGIGIMEAVSKDLDAVMVSARKPLYQYTAAGTIINVESSLLTKGSTALQVLERSPGIIIDRRNNDISMNGKNGVMVMLNGKLMRMSIDQVLLLLDGMTADDIATIELLTTPPAGYDADGSAGLINIVLKKNRRKGTNGSSSVTAGYGLREKATANINLSHNTAKLNLSGSYAYTRNNSGNGLYITGTQDMPAFGGKMNSLFTNNTNWLLNSHDARAVIETNINPTTVTGASVSFNRSITSYTARNRMLYHVNPDSPFTFDGTIKGLVQRKNIISSAFVEKQLTKTEKISANLDYIYYSNSSLSKIAGSFLDEAGNPAGDNDTLYSPDQNGFANTAIRVGVAKIDYARSFSEKVSFEAGIKQSYMGATSISGLQSLVNGNWENRNETATGIKMKESIKAGYATVNAQLSPAANLVIGLRYEYSQTRMKNISTKQTTIDRKLGVLFPSILFIKKIKEQGELQFSYSKRISRPTYNDLASYVGYADPSAVVTGNPFLKPTITNNVKVGYTVKNYAFALLFSRDQNPIVRYQLTESAARDLLLVSPKNLAWFNTIHLQTSIPVRVNHWWDMTYGFTGGWRKFKVLHTQQPATREYIGYSFTFSHTFKLPSNLTAEVSGLYNSHSYNGTVKADGYGTLNTGIKKELKNNKGSLQLSVTDILSTMRLHSYFGAFTREAFDIKNHVRYSTETRQFPIIRISYSRSFGTAFSKNQRSRTNAAEEEKSRIQ